MTSINYPSAIDPVHRTSDRRAQPRMATSVVLSLNHLDLEMSGCHAIDISKTGIAIELPRDLYISLGSVISLRLHIWTGRDHMSRYLHAEVGRYGRCFLVGCIVDHARYVNALVHDIIHYQQLERRDLASPMTRRTSLAANLNAWVAKLIS